MLHVNVNVTVQTVMIASTHTHTQSFREKVKSSLQKSVKRNSKQENFAAVQGGSVRVGRSRSFGKVDKIDQ